MKKDLVEKVDAAIMAVCTRVESEMKGSIMVKDGADLIKALADLISARAELEEF